MTTDEARRHAEVCDMCGGWISQGADRLHIGEWVYCTDCTGEVIQDDDD